MRTVFLKPLHTLAFLLGCSLALVSFIFLFTNQQEENSSETYLAVNHYAGQRARRIEILRDLYFDRTPRKEVYSNLYNALVPEVSCRSLIRVGEVLDGGKWMCRPWALPKGCAIYSLGINNDTSFEKELQGLTQSRCRLYAYDKQAPLMRRALEGFERINAQFKAAIIGQIPNETLGIVTIRDEMLRHGDKQIEILKMDIEGTEFDVLPDLIEQVDVCQILIEVHGVPPRVVGLLIRLAKKGFRFFSHEINGLFHEFAEYSFVHESCMHRYGAEKITYYLDAIYVQDRL